MTFITVNSRLRNNVAKESVTLLITTVGIVFLFSLVSFDSILQPHRVTDEGMVGVYITST